MPPKSTPRTPRNQRNPQPGQDRPASPARPQNPPNQQWPWTGIFSSIRGAFSNNRWIQRWKKRLGLVAVFCIFLLLLNAVLTSVENGIKESGPGSGAWSISLRDVWDNLGQSVHDILPTTGNPRSPGGYDNFDRHLPVPEPPLSGSTGGSGEQLPGGLENKLPERINVQVDKKGNFVISQDFWHALLHLADKGKIQVVGKKSKITVKDLEDLTHGRLSQMWQDWVKQNEKQVHDKSSTGTNVSKEEFIDLVKREIKSYDREIRNEVEATSERLEKDIRQIKEVINKPGAQAGLSPAESQKIIDAAVKKCIAKAKLDAIANGRIRGHASDMIINGVNFFGGGSGAIIDPNYSSNAWKPPKPFYGSKKYYDRTGYKPQPRKSALSPWTDEGECFCAAPDMRGYGQATNNISVLMSRNIIPQHLIVDHILPSSTLDPEAAPKDIEVWGYFEELTKRKELQTFSERSFPNTPKEEVLNEGFVKIGHFEYLNKDEGDGVQVFKFVDALKTMAAATNHVVVRAISNYGADHTCFYRLRMYGEVVERPEDPIDDSWLGKRFF
ncbi:hypothetical protein F4778DRAFT_716801 [Xylariomycetidae sp. FL2044]|nr:hypothetical protein F4778DRAFT_716801 [Xylariomycetidae sp. FL2044]